jgi:hypothetical protein
MTVVFDAERETRTGVAEAVFCAGKTPDQIATILAEAVAAGRRLLLTRLRPEAFAALPPTARLDLDYEALSATAILGPVTPEAAPIAGALIVAAGTSDSGLAQEAARTLGFHGYAAPLIVDVGVAGLWRLMARLDELRAARVLIVVAGMARDRPALLRRLRRGGRRPCRAPLRLGELRAGRRHGQYRQRLRGSGCRDQDASRRVAAVKYGMSVSLIDHSSRFCQVSGQGSRR